LSGGKDRNVFYFCQKRWNSEKRDTFVENPLR
jgi:hypothetical protein